MTLRDLGVALAAVLFCTLFVYAFSGIVDKAVALRDAEASRRLQTCPVMGTDVS